VSWAGGVLAGSAVDDFPMAGAAANGMATPVFCREEFAGVFVGLGRANGLTPAVSGAARLSAASGWGG